MTNGNSLRETYRDYLVKLLSEKYKESKSKIEESRDYFTVNRFTSGYNQRLKDATFVPIIQSAKGAYITDVDNNKFLDLTMGFGVHLFGHKVDFIKKSINSQLNDGIALGPLYQHTAEVAKLLTEMTNTERCAFFNSGTEAVMVAIRLARSKTSKQKIVIFNGSYHGTHDSTMTMSADENKNAQSSVLGIPQSYLDNTILLDFGSEESIAFIKQHHDDLAGILIEPVQSRHPERKSKEFLKSIESVCFDNNIALIFDEIITGFRIENGGAASYFDVRPDICLYGKIIGGGLPLGVVAGKKEYLDFIDGGAWNFGDDSEPQKAKTFVAGTFCHHPLAMATTKATLEFLKENNNRIQKELNSKTEYLCQKLNSFFQQNGYSIEMVYFGSLFRFIISGNAKLLFHQLLKEDVYIWEGRNCFLSSAHSDSDVEALISKIKKCCFELEASNLLPSKTKKTYNELATFTEGALEINGEINVEALEFSFNYILSSTSKLNTLTRSINHFESNKGQQVNDLFNEVAPEHKTTSGTEINIYQGANNSIIHLRIDHDYCDGWSLTIILRQLSKVYNNFVSNQLLEYPLFKPSSVIEEKINTTFTKSNSPVYNADSIQQIISIEYLEGNQDFFSLALLHFYNSFAIRPNVIDIPVAGQIQSRELKVVGQCTVHIPIENDSVDQKSVASELLKKRSEWTKYIGQNNKGGIVFNYDNLNFELNFGGNPTNFVQVPEQTTQHGLVCNITRHLNDLHIFIKYRPTEYSLGDVELIMSNFIKHLKQTK